MIYWFIGQPGCGKTTLAKKWSNLLRRQTRLPNIHLDGDELRRIYGNVYSKEHFTPEYRIEQTRILQRLVEHMYSQGVDIIVSTVNSIRSVREEFKTSNKDVIEIYITNSGKHVRSELADKKFEEPLTDFITVDTKDLTSSDSFDILLKELLKIIHFPKE